MAVITISRQYGSGADEIADRVCEALGYRTFDKRLIARAAAEAGISAQEAIDYSEENYKVKGFLDRLFSRSSPVAQVRVWREDPSGTRSTEDLSLSEDAALSLVQHAIRSAYEAGNVVIMGRGGQALLKDKPGVLHVRLEAPLEERIQRVKERFKESRHLFQADIEIRREAQDYITQRDQASGDYLLRYYNFDWTDSLQYHMILNTGKLSIDQAVEMIVALARQMDKELLAAHPVQT